MGLNAEAARIPGASAGVLSVLFIYLLVDELFKNKKIATISALFLAISPWDIQFSRGSWEVNVATFFVLLGVYLFVVFTRSKKFWHLALSIFFFSFISLYIPRTAPDRSNAWTYCNSNLQKGNFC